MLSAYSSSSEPPGWAEEPWGLANVTAYNGTAPGTAPGTASGTAPGPGLSDTLLATVAAAASGLVSGLADGLAEPKPAAQDASAAALAHNATLAGLGGNQTAPALPAFCEGWEAIQNNLFQVSNLFFCIAFLVPRTFKQSVLLYRFLLVIGFMLAAGWASFHLCAFDVFLWSLALMAINGVHTAFLVVRFLPPALSPDLTELYLKVFKPLKVSKKAFKELAREGSVLTLEAGDAYAVEEQTPADERLSILLKGKLAVSCDGTHLHHINTHQFVDSPEWEANHDSSENTFQVTISAEEECLYLCWPRMKLSRVLRHRPQVRIVLDTLIGKDITHKLYSLNEQMHGAGERAKAVRSDHWRRSMARSVSVDAVNTGTRGNVRSTAFKAARKERASSAAALGEDVQNVLQSPVRHGSAQCWIPLVANHFPVTSPFTDAQGMPQPLTAAVANAPLGVPLGSLPPGVPVSGVPTMNVSGVSVSGVGGVPVSMPGLQLPQLPSSMALVPVPVIVPVLAPPPTLHQARNRTMRRAGAGAGVAGVAGVAPSGAVKFEATPV
ncbi:blood vessel epicardial substance-like [Thrips palmi]|uniref:Blood vessel epicardial substance-like n=1 Tax=Thrips palmi TaxID=161013 RepID=A0A6P8ZLK4_THRPL|nr:blood vessel epicardial substance-like [Thrips palmi]